MKPPLRRRSAPVRYEIKEAGQARTTSFRLDWTSREKMALLRGLNSQADQKVPEPQVPGRSPSEVSSYISWLRGRAAREAIQTEYETWVQEKKSRDARTPAPIEIWCDLAGRMSDPTEEAVTSAFSQMLTIASAEPANLRHSIPSKAPGGAPPDTASKHSPQPTASSEEVSGSSGEEPAAPADETGDGWQKLDFEKIYMYLAKAARGDELPKVSEFESAVLLRLIHCIPSELQTLDKTELEGVLQQTYTTMNSQAREKSAEETQPEPAAVTSWKDAGFCPLNPFLLPLRLLQRKESPLPPSRPPDCHL